MKVGLRFGAWLRERGFPGREDLESRWTNGCAGLMDCWRQSQDFIKHHSLIGGGIIISVAALFSVTFWYAWCLTPTRGGSHDVVIVDIPYGAGLRQVSRDLRAKGLIHNELGFELYVRLGHPGMILQAGCYQFSPAMSLGEIVGRIHRGAIAVNRVTFPEGLTVDQITGILQARGLIRKERFRALLQNNAWIKNRFKSDFDTGSWPEGYLFPDTYQFHIGATEAEIIGMMLKRFEEVFTAHFPRVAAAERRKIVIIASLVEKEAKRPEERAIIAGVFYNRLRRDYPLQSCATVEYALGTHKTRLSYRDIKINSPYNTYEHYGLPPGPIANPGLASLTAAVHPAKVDYLYFVAKPDGGHVFSETYEAHLRAQSRIKRGSR